MSLEENIKYLRENSLLVFNVESYYDTIQDFRYWDVKAWKGYIKEYVRPIHESTATLLKLRDELSPYIGSSLNSVREADERLLPFFIGGIDEDGNYWERSLAKLIRLMFGIYVEPREFSGTVAMAGEEGFREVKVIEEEEKLSFLRLIRGLNKFSGDALQKAGIEVEEPETVDEILQNPNKLLDVLKELYKACISFSANHNYYTLFIVSTASIHWGYLLTAYPKLYEHFEKIRDFLGLEPIFAPETDSKYYTIWGHRAGGIADDLYGMQMGLWAFFDFEDLLKDSKEIEEVFKYITSKPENLTEEYLKRTKALVREEEISFSKNKDSRFYLKNKYRLTIRGLWITSWPNEFLINTYPAESKRYIIEREYSKPKIPLIDFLDRISPWLFLGLSALTKTEREDELYYIGNVPKRAKWWFK